jgi:hypothetical protein
MKYPCMTFLFFTKAHIYFDFICLNRHFFTSFFRPITVRLILYTAYTNVSQFEQDLHFF